MNDSWMYFGLALLVTVMIIAMVSLHEMASLAQLRRKGYRLSFALILVVLITLAVMCIVCGSLMLSGRSAEQALGAMMVNSTILGFGLAIAAFCAIGWILLAYAGLSRADRR